MLEFSDIDHQWCNACLVGESPLAQAVFRLPDGRLLNANPAFLRLIGSAAVTLPEADWETYFGAATEPRSLLCNDSTHLEVGVVSTELLSPSGLTLRLVYIDSPPAIGGPIDARARLMASVFEHGTEAILITDAANRIVDTNPAFTRLTGYSRAESLGRNPGFLASGRTPPERYAEMWEGLKNEGSWQGEIWDKRKDDSVYPKWLSISAVHDEAGVLANYVASFTDLTERKEAADRLSHLATHDALTDLLNRYALETHFGTALATARRDKHSVALMLIDLDRFKDINDNLGHHIGDGLLAQVAERLRESVRSSDIVARLGGDEFVVALPDIENPMAVAGITSKLHRSLAEPYTVDGYSLYSTPSIGIAIYPADGDTPEELMRHADVAMYHAKAQGKNNFQFFDQYMNEASRERLDLEMALREALESTCLANAPQFQLYFQPQLHLETGRIIGLEALARWTHPELGQIPPTRFIPVAEDTGLIQPLGDWVFWEACRHLRSFKDAGLDGIRVAVNLSCQQLRHEALPVVVRGALACYDLVPADLELEITESTAMQNPTATIAILQQLNDIGIALAIDDFGTGYSSLSYLKHLPVHRLKLDRSFVQEIETNRSDAAICSATIVLGHNLGLDLVAEGVETQAQRDHLARLGCDVAQGFLYCRPIPADELIDFVRGWRASMAQN